MVQGEANIAIWYGITWSFGHQMPFPLALYLSKGAHACSAFTQSVGPPPSTEIASKALGAPRVNMESTAADLGSISIGSHMVLVLVVSERGHKADFAVGYLSAYEFRSQDIRPGFGTSFNTLPSTLNQLPVHHMYARACPHWQASYQLANAVHIHHGGYRPS